MVARSAQLLMIALLACGETTTEFEPPEIIADADRVLSLDIDGDGRDELIAIANGRATWSDQDVLLGGDPQVQGRGTLDGQDVVLLGTGRGRSSPDAPGRIWQFDRDGARIIWENDGDHHRFADLRIVDGKVFFAVFGRGKQVVGGWLEDGKLREVARRPMAVQQIPLPGGGLAMGRLYGDAPRSDGDLIIIEDGQADRVLPTVRGVRAMTLGDVDRDGHLDLVVSDGWHFRYGEHAQAQVVLYRGPDFLDRRVLASFPGEYTVNQLEVLDWPIEGPRWVVAVGSRQVHLLKADMAGWRDTSMQSIRETSRAVVWRDQSHRWLVVAGRPTKALPLTPATTSNSGSL